MITDWDDAYANAAHIEGAEGYVARWQDKARAFRGKFADDRRREIAYGAHPRETLELFLPEGAPRGLFVFVHGGYWRTMERTMWAHLAAGPLARGWAVSLPGYVLCPEVRIGDITRQIARAVECAASEVAGPLRLAGHSAGGQLVTRLGCADVALEVAGRIEAITSISGVHDLRPLRRTAMNDDLRLDTAQARAESPALADPRGGFALTCWAGAQERPEFRRQNVLLANIWAGCGVESRAVEDAGKHHFNVIEGLEDAASPLCDAALG